MSKTKAKTETKTKQTTNNGLRKTRGGRRIPLTHIQDRYLRCVRKGSRFSVASLAEVASVSYPAAYRQVQALVAKGWVSIEKAGRPGRAGAGLYRREA